MCGLSCVFSLSGDNAEPGAIEALHSQIQARGPDGEGIYQSSLALAHRRLAIIDTSVANQPFFGVIVMLLYLMEKFIIIENFGLN